MRILANGCSLGVEELELSLELPDVVELAVHRREAYVCDPVQRTEKSQRGVADQRRLDLGIAESAELSLDLEAQALDVLERDRSLGDRTREAAQQLRPIERLPARIEASYWPARQGESGQNRDSIVVLMKR